MECGIDRQNQEKSMQIQNKILKEREKLRVKTSLDGSNNVAISQLQDAWSRFSPRWKILEGHRNSLISKWQSEKILENQEGVVETVKEIKKPDQELQENSEFIQENRFMTNRYCHVERDCQLLEETLGTDIEYKKQEAECGNNIGLTTELTCKNWAYASNMKQYDHELQRERLHLRGVLDSMQGKLKRLQVEFSSINNERESYNLKLNAVNRNISILEQQRIILQRLLNEYKERTESIQNEIKYLLSQIEKNKSELEYCLKIEQKILCDKACQVEIDVDESGPAVDILSSNEKEMKLLQERHQEELQIYKVKLVQAVKQICFLNEQLKVSPSIRSTLCPTNSGKSKFEMHKCSSTVNSNLVEDGIQVNNSLSERSGENNKDYNFKKNDITYIGHVTCPVCGSEDSKLASYMTELFDNFKHTWISILGEEVKHCTIDFDFRFNSLENSIQELISLTKRNIQTNSLNDEIENTKHGKYMGSKPSTRPEDAQESCMDANSLNALEDFSKDKIYKKNRSTRRELQAHCEEIEQCIPYDLKIKHSKVDCGTGYAYNFVYGYLKYVLPPGVKFSSKGLERRIYDYIYDNRLKDEAFPLKKLIILIPHNAKHVPPNLRDLSIDNSCDGNKYWMESAGSLEAEIIDREGVQRTYEHTVYKIKDPERKGTYDYVVAEFATPLKIFCEAQSTSNPRRSKAFKMHQQKLVSLFHKSLIERLKKNEDCEKLCEVIYYPDTENGKKVNIARVILDRINQRKNMS
ncbi:hypothetical protein C0J52_22737 [Blattella germanica]|nr:hypothetical protein C0J52_22737 [Blattella germanica]